MRLVTVHLPVELIEGLDFLVRTQRYPNRSEAIRSAIRDLLKEELWKRQKVSKERIIPKTYIVPKEKVKVREQKEEIALTH
ncbi:MAG: ribbon-helix-helix domain-containing protein [Candidatus Wukongarchaeota archaeon]|nr:ribbon-helix-helix domain-containing protein [Candidatus Wukongarchaeota archaeon]MDO8129946.1 ribbon-helix-helix domain-containing protein [Candidatus Wukongarchaeota archaeon]